MVALSLLWLILQLGGPSVAATLPSTCAVGNLGYKTTSPIGLYVCDATNTWTLVAAPGGGGVPSGATLLIVSGTCPAGFTESSALDGKMLRGTVAAHGDVGATGGSATITPTFNGSSATTSAITAGTPAGSNSAPSFTGGAWSAPAIAWPAGVPTYTGTVNTLAVTAHTVVATKQGTAAGNVVTTATHVITGIPGGSVAWPAGVPTIGAYTPTGTVGAPTFTGSALGTHSHTLTAIGTIPAFDPSPPYTKVIFCVKD